ncbi:MAG: hypothetical protein DME76_14390 [Verrucomicrobia bacterium]|nr:MAG: hypothetical protein DME76_14390 [Verrucomicrobiota bacterium]
MVTVGVLVLLVLLFTQLLNTAANVTTLGHKQMDADSQARGILDRMAIDFAQMVKRSDVDFFGKGTPAPNSAMTGNDQIAFYTLFRVTILRPARKARFRSLLIESTRRLVRQPSTNCSDLEKAWSGTVSLRLTHRLFLCRLQFQQLGRLRPAVRHLTAPTK